LISGNSSLPRKKDTGLIKAGKSLNWTLATMKYLNELEKADLEF